MSSYRVLIFFNNQTRNHANKCTCQLLLKIMVDLLWSAMAQTACHRRFIFIKWDSINFRSFQWDFYAAFVPINTIYTFLFSCLQAKEEEDSALHGRGSWNELGRHRVSNIINVLLLVILIGHHLAVVFPWEYWRDVSWGMVAYPRC